MRTFTAYVQFDPATKRYVATVPGVRRAHTQAASLDELRENLKEVLELCIEEGESGVDDPPKFVGLQQVEVEL